MKTTITKTFTQEEIIKALAATFDLPSGADIRFPIHGDKQAAVVTYAANDDEPRIQRDYRSAFGDLPPDYEPTKHALLQLNNVAEMGLDTHYVDGQIVAAKPTPEMDWCFQIPYDDDDGLEGFYVVIRAWFDDGSVSLLRLPL